MSDSENMMDMEYEQSSRERVFSSAMIRSDHDKAFSREGLDDVNKW